MNRTMLLIGVGVGVALQGGVVHAIPAATTACRSPSSASQDIRRFARLLLDRKDPAAAYERYASPTMIQRNPPFGDDRSSTIRQWLTMTRLPASRFTITSIRRKGDVFTIVFDGELGPGQAATVTQHDRVACGKIVEEWATFTVHQPPATPPAG